MFVSGNFNKFALRIARMLFFLNIAAISLGPTGTCSIYKVITGPTVSFNFSNGTNKLIKKDSAIERRRQSQKKLFFSSFILLN